MVCAQHWVDYPLEEAPARMTAIEDLDGRNGTRQSRVLVDLRPLARSSRLASPRTSSANRV